MSDQTFTCEQCGRELPKRQLKEVVYEEGKERIQKRLCPSCLDQAMNESSSVRGVVGTEKAAAVHIDPGPGPARRESFGKRT